MTQLDLVIRENHSLFDATLLEADIVYFFYQG